MRNKYLMVMMLLLPLTACMSFSDRDLRPVRDALAAQFPDMRLEKEVAISMGGTMFNFLDVVTLNEADLSQVDALQVAVYTVHSRGEAVIISDETILNSLSSKDANLHWERIVRVRDEGEQVWIFAGLDLQRNRLAGLSVFVYERNELVLISLEGDLEQMLDYAMAPGRGHRGVYSGV